MSLRTRSRIPINSSAWRLLSDVIGHVIRWQLFGHIFTPGTMWHHTGVYYQLLAGPFIWNSLRPHVRNSLPKLSLALNFKLPVYFRLLMFSRLQCTLQGIIKFQLYRISKALLITGFMQVHVYAIGSEVIIIWGVRAKVVLATEPDILFNYSIAVYTTDCRLYNRGMNIRRGKLTMVENW